MIKIGITGVPGAGKTSLARAVTSACRRIEGLKNIELVSEYARRYIRKHSSVDHIWEQYRIMEKQVEWEDCISESDTDILVTDSPVHLGFLYASELVTNSPKDIMIYNDIFKALTKLNENKPRYDAIFHLPPDVKPVDDGVRAADHLDEEWRKQNDIKLRFIIETLCRPGEFFIIDNIDMEYRTNYIISAIKNIL